MLYLMFRIGADRYVLDIGQIEQVLPYLAVKELPGVPPGIAGIVDYHGEPVPLVDLSLMALGRPVAALMSTRIILVRYESGDGQIHRLALCAEKVVSTIRREPSDFVPTGVEAGMPAYLGPVVTDEKGVIQLVRVEALLSDEVRAVLFRRLREAADAV